MLSKIVKAFRLVYIYLLARTICFLHYDYSALKKTKYFAGGKYGEFTASGWQWVVNDYRNCKRLNVNRDARWPVSARINVVFPENISFHPDDLNNFQGFGNYYQAIGKITIGRGTYIAPNVGIITSNHSLENLDEHDKPKPVTLGENCWIGMNSMILPGVVLGPQTTVGAGAVVTKSFPEGHCIIAGNPARMIQKLD